MNIYEDNNRVAKKLEKYLNHTITRLNKDIVCKIEVTQGSTIMPFDIEIYFLSSVGIRTREDILNKAWDFIYNATGKSSGVYSEIVDDCQEPMNLQESIRRILREKLNEKEFFFPRRIKFGDVKKRLPINTEMVYYDTETYDEFKYLLTLTAVEEIMWNDHKIHWEDLPEKEEIEFVTELSNKFEKTIRRLYNVYQNK